MTALLTLMLFLAEAAPLSLDQIRADPNLEHRARTAIEYAVAAERNAENAYSADDAAGMNASLKAMATAVEIARDALMQTGRTPQRHPGPYKFAEVKTEGILLRLGDLEKRLAFDERPALEAPKNKVQEIHDAWFEGIMGRKK